MRLQQQVGGCDGGNREQPGILVAAAVAGGDGRRALFDIALVIVHDGPLAAAVFEVLVLFHVAAAPVVAVVSVRRIVCVVAVVIAVLIPEQAVVPVAIRVVSQRNVTMNVRVVVDRVDVALAVPSRGIVTALRVFQVDLPVAADQAELLVLVLNNGRRWRQFARRHIGREGRSCNLRWRDIRCRWWGSRRGSGRACDRNRRRRRRLR